MRKLKETVADVPFLMEEWDFEANSAQGLFPEKLGSQSNEPANWKCRYGHRGNHQKDGAFHAAD